MNRLFVKVKTDLRRKGTLLEVRGDRTVQDMLQHIVNIMDLKRNDAQGQLIEYRLVRIGRPSVLLDSLELFAKTGVQNNDVLLLQVGSTVLSGDSYFEFQPIFSPQDVSVQDLRETLRLPLSSLETSNGESSPMQTNDLEPQSHIEAKPGTEPNAITGAFNFTPLALEITQETPTSSETPAANTDNRAVGFKKIDPSDL
jgi:hypothetical protein